MQTSQIVHESEVQRQFVRLQLPASTRIDTKVYSVRDLSSGGVGVRDYDGSIKKGQEFSMTLTLPFQSFSLDIELKAQAQHIDKKLNVMGCRFVNLTPEQLSILNHVIKAFIAGDVVKSADILHVVSRDNFVKVRQQKNAADMTFQEKLKEYSGYAALAVVSLVLAFFIFANVFENSFVLKSDNAFIQNRIFEPQASAGGVFNSTVESGRKTVKKGEVIADISTPVGPGITPVSIPSPCDCFIVKTHVENGQYAAPGTVLFTLIPEKETPWVSATIEMKDIHRLKIGGKVNVKIAGTGQELTGKITDITRDYPGILKDATTPVIPTGIVTVKTDKPLQNDFIGRPVYLEFLLL